MNTICEFHVPLQNKNVDNLKAYNPPRPFWYEIKFQDDELQPCAVVQYWRKELGVSENVKYSFILHIKWFNFQS